MKHPVRKYVANALAHIPSHLCAHYASSSFDIPLWYLRLSLEQDAFEKALESTCVEACQRHGSGTVPESRLGEACDKR